MDTGWTAAGSPRAKEPWPPGGGGMAGRIRAHDWAATPLGPVGGWPRSLKALVELMLASPQLATLAVGPARVFLYNDEAARHYGARHPGVLGQPLAEAFPHEFGTVAGFYDRVFAGEGLHVPAQPLDPAGTGTSELFDAYLVPVRDGDGRVVAAYMTGFAVGERRRAEAKLRESEERQAFLLGLSDALRPLTDPAEAQGEACRLLAERLDVDRAYYVEVDEAAGTARVERDFVRGGAPSIAGGHRVADFAWSVAILRRGECHVVGDARTSGLVPPADRPACAALGIVACMGAPLVKQGRLVGALCVTASRPRAWTGGELGLLCEVGERIWAAVERARAEAALRASEERFRRFADASSDVLWIRDADTVQFEYVSPAFEAVYGDRFERVLAGNDLRHWAELILPEDRGRVLDAFRRVRDGERVTHEFRIRRPMDGEVRWIRDTSFPLLDGQGRVQRIAGIGSDVTEAKHAARRQQVLIAELQHRGRNLLGVVRSLASKTVGQGGDVEGFEDRLAALSRAQGQLSLSGGDHVELEALVRAELEAHAEVGPPKVVVRGPKVNLAVEQVQTFALALHELATNAVKYGALRDADGDARLAVTWAVAGDSAGDGAGGARRLVLDWVEGGVEVRPEAATRRGYGTELIGEALAYTLRARTEHVLGHDGVRCRIEVPLAQHG